MNPKQHQPNDPLYGFKGEARRLALALKELNYGVTHSQALDLIGRVHGQRDWKELAGLTLAAAEQANAAQAAQAAAEQDQEAQLTYLEYWLRMHGVNEEDLDGLVHDYYGSEEASEINNNGLYAQLSHLLSNPCNGHFGLLPELLRTSGDIDEELHWTLPGVRATAWDSSSYTVEFDALPWLLQASKEAILQLGQSSRRHHLGNCDLGDEVAVWTRQYGREADRQAMEDVFGRVAAWQRLDEDAVGVTVSIDPRAVRRFVEYHFRPDEALPILEALDKH